MDTLASQLKSVESICENAEDIIGEMIFLKGTAPTHEIAGCDLNTSHNTMIEISKTFAGVSAYLRRMISRRTESWNETPILEAVIRHGNDTRKIVIGKPNDRVKEPFIGEAFFNAIRAKWGDGEITTDEEYDIIVINKKGRTIETIAHK